MHMRPNKIVLLQGPPCSGKTFWANPMALDMEFDRPPVIIRTKDLSWSRDEKGNYNISTLDDIEPREYAIINQAIKVDDKTVFVDATNCNTKRLQAFMGFARRLDCELVIKPFYAKYEVACERNKARRGKKEEYVPKEVMALFYKTYYLENFRDELTDKRIIKTPDRELPNCVICDLDATLALHQGRDPFEWDLLQTDKIDTRLAMMLSVLYSAGVHIIFVTGRPERVRSITIQWLLDNLKGVGKFELYMRDNRDYSHGEDYKRKIYEENIEGKYNVLCTFEDSNKCVNMYRKIGLLTCQVATTDY